MAILAPVIKHKFFTADGLPLAGGKLYSYQAGTTTPLATYTDYGGSSANANPVVLDANGECDLWLGSQAYKFTMHNSADVLQWTVDNVNQGNLAVATSASQIENLGITTSVASNALTINLTTSLGATPSSESPVKIGFRNATLSSGLSTTVSAESAVTVVVPSGATLSHADNVANFIYVYAINNSGAIELAVSRRMYSERTTVNTVALGTGSDANNVIYSTSARTGVSLRLIGRLTSTQTTAGTWAAAITEIQTGAEAIRAEKVYCHFTSNTGNITTTPGPWSFSSTEWDPYGMADGSNGFTVPWTGLWRIEFSSYLASRTAAAAFISFGALHDGTNYIEYIDGQTVHAAGTFSYNVANGSKTYHLRAGVVYFIYVYQNSTATVAQYSGSDYKNINYLRVIEAGR